MQYVIIYLLAGLLVGALLVYFYLKASMVSRASFDELNKKYLQQEPELNNLLQKINQKDIDFKQELESLNKILTTEKANFVQQQDWLNDVQHQAVALEIENKNLQKQVAYHQDQVLLKQIDLKKATDELLLISAEKSRAEAQLEAINARFHQQKTEIENLQETAKTSFENIANKLFEEKSSKFTQLNQNNIQQILQPLTEGLSKFKEQVQKAYGDEAKERFSLQQSVADLIKQTNNISADAQKLTQALKGEAKTQGNWGEMILENILEKSGLVKNREYFMEHELKDEDNNAIKSQFDKKMRPDAVIKYPDNRHVIVDSKVSLNAFVRLQNQTDKALQDVEIQNHLKAIKHHITDLSLKAYDDYNRSLDFVMMFIPNEPAYICAMQADPELWNFAYQKRILLLSPTNLITSLKLVADLWKREYQNQNAIEIAERGARLYDKLAGFVENFEKIGKQIDQTKSLYDSSFKQLSSGAGNIIKQSQDLKTLGVKAKKELPQSLVEQAENQNNISND